MLSPRRMALIHSRKLWVSNLIQPLMASFRTLYRSKILLSGMLEHIFTCHNWYLWSWLLLQLWRETSLQQGILLMPKFEFAYHTAFLLKVRFSRTLGIGATEACLCHYLNFTLAQYVHNHQSWTPPLKAIMIFFNMSSDVVPRKSVIRSAAKCQPQLGDYGKYLLVLWFMQQPSSIACSLE